MNEQNILVDGPRIQAARDAMRVHVNRIRSIIADLEKDIRGVSERWTGSAPERWRMNQRLIHNELNDMNRVLNTVGDEVVDTSVAFLRTDKNMGDRFTV